MTTEPDEPPNELDRRAFLRTVAGKSGTAVAGFVLGLLVDTTWARLVRGFRLQREEYPKAVVAGYRVHHNVVGYILILAGVFVHPLILVPAGLGMIVGHARRDRLYWFIERVG